MKISGSNLFIYDINDDLILHISCEEPSMSMKYTSFLLGYFAPNYLLILAHFGVTSVYFAVQFFNPFLGCRRSFQVLLYLLHLEVSLSACQYCFNSGVKFTG